MPSYVKPMLIGLAVACGVIAVPCTLAAQDPHGHHAAPSKFPIPASIRAEHAEILGGLIAATKLAGKTGEAARNLARVLEPHFQREEQIALPPLGLLAPLSRGVLDPSMAGILPLTDSLRAEMPKMLAEHVQIRAAVLALEAAAREGNYEQALSLAEKLKVHALTEEEVSYPAALVVGDMVRARGIRK